MPRKKKSEDVQNSFKESIKKDMQTQLRGGLTKVVNKEVIIAPSVDIYDNKTDYLIVLAMPGVKNDNINITIDDKEITIEEKKVERKPKVSAKNIILEEIEKKKYYRKFTLTNEIDTKNINAVVEDGLITITLPKIEE